MNRMLLANMSEFLKTNFGLSFPEEKYRDVERGIAQMMKKMGENDPASFVEKITALPISKEQLDILCAQFTIGETYFFREPDYFQALKNTILPELIESRRNTGKMLRIWSAGCSSGEEPYTLAIIVSELIEDLENWNITILATDINNHALRKLNEGIYGEWSFRNVPNHIKEKYFKKHGKNHYEIKPLFKSLVKANYLNLAQDTYPSLLNNTNAMDIIFCRNLLMYFETPLINQILSHFRESLIEGGYMIVGSSEHSLMPSLQYHKNRVGNAILYQKQSGRIEERQEEPFTYFTEHEPRDFSAQATPQVLEDLELTPQPLQSVQTKRSPKKPKTVKNILDNDTLKSEKSAEKSEKTENVTSELELLSRKLANEGKLKEALETVEKGIQQDKCNTLLHYLKALVLEELSLSEDAIAELNKTLYLDPDFVLAYFSLGNIASNQHRMNHARKYYSIVLSLTNRYAPEDELPGSEGCLTAARLRDIIHSKKLFQLE